MEDRLETENRNMRGWRERQEMEGIFLLLTTQWAPGSHILYTHIQRKKSQVPPHVFDSAAVWTGRGSELF